MKAQFARVERIKQIEKVPVGSSIAAVAVRPDGGQIAIGKHSGDTRMHTLCFRVVLF